MNVGRLTALALLFLGMLVVLGACSQDPRPLKSKSKIKQPRVAAKLRSARTVGRRSRVPLREARPKVPRHEVFVDVGPLPAREVFLPLFVRFFEHLPLAVGLLSVVPHGHV